MNTLRRRGYINLYGVDIGEEQINYLTSYGLKLVKADIFKYLEDDTRKYDLITLFDVLEHFTKDEIAILLPLIKQRMTRSGMLVVRVPNAEAIFKGSIMYGDFTHETYLTKRSMIQLFKTFDYGTVNVYPVFGASNTLKSKLAHLLYSMYVKFYKMLLYIDNSESAAFFLPTQNILGIISK